MSSIDQSRAYLALREQITQVRREFGEDTAWHIVEQAVRSNMEEEKFYLHKVSKPQLKRMFDTEKTGESS